MNYAWEISEKINYINWITWKWNKANITVACCQIESKKPTSMAKQTYNKRAELRFFDILCYFLMNLDKNIY